MRYLEESTWKLVVDLLMKSHYITKAGWKMDYDYHIIKDDETELYMTFTKGNQKIICKNINDVEKNDAVFNPEGQELLEAIFGNAN